MAVKGMAKDAVVRTMKEPVSARNALELPSGMAPSPVATAATMGSVGDVDGWQRSRSVPGPFYRAC